MKHKLLIIISLLSVLAHLYAGFSFINVSAPTYDETVHLSSGYSYLKSGKYAMNIMDHPPLSEMISALPLSAWKLNAFFTHPYYVYRMPYHYGDLFLYQNKVDADKMLNASRRFTMALWSLLFCVFIFFFARKMHSPQAGFLSVTIFCLTPAFVSNNALVTTDSAPAVFYLAAFFFAFLFSQVSPVRKELKKGKYVFIEKTRMHAIWAMFCGLATGLAMSSKFSMFVLPPFIIILWIFDNILDPKMNLKRMIWLCLIYLFSTLFILAFVYKFDLTLYFNGLNATIERLEQGRSSFIIGQHTTEGFWWYFPFTFLVKNPEFLLLLFASGALFCGLGFKKKHIWIITPFVFYFAASLFSKVQIGFRHLMPVMPFAVMIAGMGLAGIIERNKKLMIAPLLLFLLFIKTIVQTHPYYLSYFNEIAGGAGSGYKLLTDSNLDWGQDVKTLSTYLKENGNPPVIFSYFGVARPEYYGIKYLPAGIISNIELEGTNEDLCKMKRILLCVSATNLQSTYYRDKRTFEWLKKEKPLFIAGNSIVLYDLTANKNGMAGLIRMFEGLGMKKETGCLRAHSGSNSSLPTPQTGHVQSSGSFSKGVPGAMLRSGSPVWGS